MADVLMSDAGRSSRPSMTSDVTLSGASSAIVPARPSFASKPASPPSCLGLGFGLRLGRGLGRGRELGLGLGYYSSRPGLGLAPSWKRIAALQRGRRGR